MDTPERVETNVAWNEQLLEWGFKQSNASSAQTFIFYGSTKAVKYSFHIFNVSKLSSAGATITEGVAITTYVMRYNNTTDPVGRDYKFFG